MCHLFSYFVPIWFWMPQTKLNCVQWGSVGQQFFIHGVSFNSLSTKEYNDYVPTNIWTCRILIRYKRSSLGQRLCLFYIFVLVENKKVRFIDRHWIQSAPWRVPFVYWTGNYNGFEKIRWMQSTLTSKGSLLTWTDLPDLFTKWFRKFLSASKNDVLTFYIIFNFLTWIQSRLKSFQIKNS